MKVSDFIADFIAKQGIYDIFGYQGTMIAHFVDSIGKHKLLKNHSCYNEQGGAFAAVGYAKATGKIGIAYATSGPGALNLISGIADAYFDSIPAVFFAGQLNLYEYTGVPTIRQQGFQEVDILSSVKKITKYCVRIEHKNEIRYELEKAFHYAQEGRKGPVLIDIPMNIQREEIEPQELSSFHQKLIDTENIESITDYLLKELRQSKRPIFLLGNAIKKNSTGHRFIKKLINKLQIPVITSMPAKHLFDSTDELYFGYLGFAYGYRSANLIASKKADLIISFGCSMCRRQTGVNSQSFAENAKIIRIDIDNHELKRKVHNDEVSFPADYEAVIQSMLKKADCIISNEWVNTCSYIKRTLKQFDDIVFQQQPNTYIKTLSESLDKNVYVFVDVGQHQLWAAQSFDMIGNRQMFFSGGHGAMGFSLPAAIGGYYACGNRCITLCGDGAFQMNIQELQWIVRENIPILMFIFNNKSLGLIRQQQNDFFDSNYFGSADDEFTAPSFSAIGEAYGITSFKIYSEKELENRLNAIEDNKPYLFEIMVSEDSMAYPKTYFGEKMYNQRPYITDEVLNELLEI